MTRANVVVRKILPGRGNTAVSATYTGIVGEITVDTDLDTLRVHDGVTAGGKRLATYAEVQAVATGNIDISGITANVTAAVVANIGQITYSNTNVTAYLSHVTGNIIPQTNVAYSLGDPTHQWKSLYVSGQTIYIGGIAVSVGPNGLSSSAGFDLANANATSLLAGNITSNGNVTAGNVYADQFFYSNGTAFVGGANLTPINANIAAANAAISAVTTAWTANASTQATDINALRANITAANATVLSNYNTLLANAGVAHSEIDSLRANITAANVAWQANTGTLAGSITSNYNTLIANLAFAHGEIDGLRANITASNVSIASLQSNAGTQQAQINAINANVAAANAAIAAIQTGSGFATVDQITANIATVTANAATQASDINALRANVTAANSAIATLQTQTYTNTNTAAYLAGNVTTGNLTVSTDAVVLGNMRVQGTQTTVNAATLTVDDLWVTVANGAVQASDANGAGLRVAGALANIAYSSTSDSFNFNKPITVDKLFTGNITSGDHSWQFSSNSKLIFPPTTFGMMGPAPETVSGIEFNTNGIPKTITDQGDLLRINVGDNENASWWFGNDGNVYMPSINNNGLIFNWTGTTFDFTRIAAEGVLTNPSLVLRTGDINSGARNAWSFDSVGNITFPDNTKFSGNTTYLPNSQGASWKFYEPMVGSDTVKLYMNELTTGWATWALSTGNGANSWYFDSDAQEFSLFNGGAGAKLVFGTAANAGVRSSVDDIELKSTIGNVYITANSNPWTFSETGNLILPTRMDFSSSPAVSGTGIVFGDGSYQYTAWTGAPGNELVNGVHTATLDSAGNLTVPNAILPTVDNTQDLGSPTYRFRHLYVGPGTVYVGNAAIKTTATGNLILPGLTRAVASSSYVESVEDEDDQTQTFTTVPTVIDNAYYSYLNGNSNNLSFTPAEYSVDQLDGEGYIDGITVDVPGSGYASEVARLAEQNMWATEVATPFASFDANDWIQIPFRAETRAGESEYEFNQGSGSSDRLVNDDHSVVLDADGNTTFSGTITMGNGDAVIGQDGDDFVISWDNEALVLRAEQDDVQVQADRSFQIDTDYSGSYKRWVFDTNGYLVHTTGDTQVYSELGNLTLQGGAVGLGSGNVNIVAVETGVAVQTWAFGNDGVLKLPSGGDIVDSTGTSVLGGGGNANTGDITFEDSILQSNVSYNTLNLDDSGGVRISTAGDNSLNITANANGTGKTWEFGTNGRLYLPAQGSIEFQDGTIQTTAYTGGGGGNIAGLTSTVGNQAGSHGSTVYSLTLNSDNDDDNPQIEVYKGTGDNNSAISIGQSNSGFRQANVIAIGNDDVGYDALPGGVYIGYQAGWNDTEDPQGLHAIAIGSKAAYTFATNNSITLNATGNDLTPDESGLFIKPIREEQYDDAVLYYNVQSGEVTYATNTGGGAAIGNTAPTAVNGRLWYNTEDGRTYVYALDTWIDASPAVVPGNMVGYDLDGNITLRDDASINYANGTSIINSVYGDADVAEFLDAYTGNIAKVGSDPLSLTAANIELSSDNETWRFASTGNIVFPDGSEQATAYTGGGGSSYGNVELAAFLTDYEGNIYINSESSGLIIDAAGDKRVGFMKYFGIESSFVHANGPTKSVPFQIGRVAADDITRANNSVFTSEIYISNVGKVGINTTSPTEQLDVNGVIRARGAIYARPGSSYGVYFTETGSSQGSITTDVDAVMQVSTSGGMVVNASGNRRLVANLSATVLSGGNDLIIESNTTSGTKTWTFDADGNLAVPGNINFANGTNILSTVSTNTGNITFDGSEIITADNSITLQVPTNVPTGVANWEGQGGWNQAFYGDLATTGGTGTGLTVDVAAGGGGYINIEAITINNPGSGYTNGDVITIDNENNLPGTFTLIVPTQNWNFGADGNITLPSGGKIGTVEAPTSVDLYGDSDNEYVQINWNNQNFVYVDQYGAHMQAGPTAPGQYEIFLANTGATTFPDHMPVTITGNLTVGNLTVNGNSTIINAQSYTVVDNIIQMAVDNPADTLDLGFVAHRTVNGTLQHTGLVRDASTGIWELFSNVTTQPGTTVDFTQALLDDLQLDKLYADTIHLTGAAPSTDAGASGDLAGDIHIDSNYLYYCTSDYVASSYIVGWEGASGNTLFITKGSYPDPQVGWSVDNASGYGPWTIDTVTDNGSNWQITFTGTPYGAPGGGNATLTNPSQPAIWKTVPLTTFQAAVTGTYSNTNVAAYLTSQNITSANIGAFQTYANATFTSGGGSTYSNANVVSMLGANTAVFVGNVNTYPLQANSRVMLLGGNLSVYDGYGNFPERSMLMNNLYYDVNGQIRYRNSTSYGAASLNFAGASGFLFGGITGGVTGNAIASTGLWATISSGGLSTGSGLGIAAGGGLTTGTGLVITNAATSSLFNTTATTINFGGAATTIAMGAASTVVTVGGGTGNVNAYHTGNVNATSVQTANAVITGGYVNNLANVSIASAGNISGVGNIIGATSNTTITAGTYISTFDNVGNVTLPNVYVSGNIVVGGGQWISYTPTWTGSSSNPAIGNGVLEARYRQTGKTVDVYIRILMGSSTTYGSGNWRLTLPVASVNAYNAILNAVLLDTGTQWYQATAFNAYDANTGYVTLFYGTAPVSSSAPFTWASGDTFIITGSYEAA